MSDFKRQIVAFNEHEYDRAIVEANKKIKRLVFLIFMMNQTTL